MRDKIKILCVEDEVDVRESLVGILESEDFEVVQAENGKKGLEIFLNQNPDLIISDVMMPESSGHDLLKAIRNNKEIDNSNIPFILLSALGQKEDVIKGVRMEASDYLTKPVDFDLLIAKIREKTANFQKSIEVNNKNLSNLKSQVSNIIPSEISKYVDLISKISATLRTEIYGPLPHKKYLDDINKIYINSLKLKTAVNNFLDEKSLANHLDVEDKITKSSQIVKDFIASLNSKFSAQIEFSDFNNPKFLDIKINKKTLTDIFKKLAGLILKANEKTKIRITISDDHFGGLVYIFYPQASTDVETFQSQIDKLGLDPLLESQGLALEIIKRNESVNIVLTIPDYRVLGRSYQN
ncbi:MAG: CheY-like chemotaxis protein [Myxococcota bacterium]|jgi:CheY-like chemotaxis protein